jgi:hypothetical protein
MGQITTSSKNIMHADVFAMSPVIQNQDLLLLAK